MSYCYLNMIFTQVDIFSQLLLWVMAIGVRMSDLSLLFMILVTFWPDIQQEYKSELIKGSSNSNLKNSNNALN